MSNRHTRLLTAAALIIIVAVCAVIYFTSGSLAGFQAQIANTANTAGTASAFTCKPGTAPAVATITGVADVSGATAATGRQACPRDAGTGFIPSNTTAYTSSATRTIAALPQFTEEIWFKTTASGALLTEGDNGSTNLAQNGHVLYLNTAGQIVFGIARSGTITTLTTTTSYLDGAWHYVAATLTTAGMSLYIDGALTATNTYTRNPPGASAAWQVGFGTLAGWPQAPTTAVFPGALRYASVYPTPLTSADVAAHYTAGS